MLRSSARSQGSTHERVRHEWGSTSAGWTGLYKHGERHASAHMRHQGHGCADQQDVHIPCKIALQVSGAKQQQQPPTRPCTGAPPPTAPPLPLSPHCRPPAAPWQPDDPLQPHPPRPLQLAAPLPVLPLTPARVLGRPAGTVLRLAAPCWRPSPTFVKIERTSSGHFGF